MSRADVCWRLGLALVLLRSADLRGQEALPVDVAFSFGAEVRNMFPMEADALEQQVSDTLAASLSHNVGYWTYRGMRQAAYPRLEIRLRQERPQWLLVMQLLRSAEASVGSWKLTLYDPGVAALPSKRRLQQDVARRFEELILDPELRRQLIEKLGEGAPMGREAATPPRARSAGPLFGVLPLRWEKYCDLARSVFEVECVKGPIRVRLLSEGTGQWAGYRPENPKFLGIQVKLLKWNEDEVSRHRAELVELSPFLFRLKDFRIDPTACLIRPSGLGPAVAP